MTVQCRELKLYVQTDAALVRIAYVISHPVIYRPNVFYNKYLHAHVFMLHLRRRAVVFRFLWLTCYDICCSGDEKSSGENNKIKVKYNNSVRNGNVRKLWACFDLSFPSLPQWLTSVLWPSDLGFFVVVKLEWHRLFAGPRLAQRSLRVDHHGGPAAPIRGPETTIV